MARVLDRVNEVLQNPVCPLCQHSEWTVADGFTVFPLGPTSNKLELGAGPVMPSVVLVCTTCGNSHFLNAKVLGINELNPDAGQS